MVIIKEWRESDSGPLGRACVNANAKLLTLTLSLTLRLSLLKQVANGQFGPE